MNTFHPGGRGMRALVTGWPGVDVRTATAADALAMSSVRGRLLDEGLPCDIGWDRAARSPSGPALDDVDPDRYSHLVWVRGPLRGRPIERVHQRFAAARRIAVDVSVVDAADPAVTGFDAVIARDAPGQATHRDISAIADVEATWVVGVVLPAREGDGGHARHPDVAADVERWLTGLDVARLPLDPRLDPGDWRRAATPAQLHAVLGRLDAVVTMGVQGLVLALQAGIPAVAVDPVAGGADVAAQAAAWDWPAVVAADDLTFQRLDERLAWCCSSAGRAAARSRSQWPADDGRQLDRLVEALHAPSPAAAGGTGV